MARATHLGRARAHEIEEERAIETDHKINIAARIIWFVAGVILTLLAFRFILALFGANPNNAFADFIYSASHPFVAPFFSLFNYSFDDGVGRFELYTLIAMAVYAMIAYGLAYLVSIPRR